MSPRLIFSFQKIERVQISHAHKEFNSSLILAASFSEALIRGEKKSQIKRIVLVNI